MVALTRLFDRILLAGGILSGCVLIIIMLMITVKVIFRYVLHEGLIGVDLLSGTLLVYMTFLGAAWVLKHEKHVVLDVILNQASPSSARWMRITSSLLGAAICFVVVVFGTWESISSFQRGILIPAEIEIPRVINLWIIPAGCLLLCCQFLRRALCHYLSESKLTHDPNKET